MFNLGGCRDENTALGDPPRYRRLTTKTMECLHHRLLNSSRESCFTCHKFHVTPHDCSAHATSNARMSHKPSVALWSLRQPWRWYVCYSWQHFLGFFSDLCSSDSWIYLFILLKMLFIGLKRRCFSTNCWLYEKGKCTELAHQFWSTDNYLHPKTVAT